MTDRHYDLMTNEERRLFDVWNESGAYPKSKFADAVIDSYFERVEQVQSTAEKIALMYSLSSDAKMIGFMFGYKYALKIIKEGANSEDS